jgi:predicted NAD/FAD-dependent oxidoreductase
VTGAAPATDVLVIGAGIAGLTAAARLRAAGRSVTVLDKGRGVGGRMATRRLGGGVFDHGAQFFTTPGSELAGMADGWAAAGVVEPWFRGRLEPDGSLLPDGHVRWRGRRGMTDVAKHLAAGLDVRTGHRVTALRPVAEGPVRVWGAELDDGEELSASALVLTAPVPQTLDLLDAGGATLAPPDREELSALAYHRCLAVLAELDGPSGLPDPGARRLGGEPIEFVADNQIKGISPVPALTVHAGSLTSLELWERGDADVVDALLDAVPGLLARPVENAVQVQRWRYARPVECRPETFRILRGLPPAVLAGDIFGGPLVGGAARSGAAAAGAVEHLLPNNHSE